MTIYRELNRKILHLLHFDYPYFNEEGDGLGDDTSQTIDWKRYGNAKLVGSETPADEIISGTPKFGYRCLSTESNSDYVASISSPYLYSYYSFEFSLYVRPTAQQAGNIINIIYKDVSVFSVTLDSTMAVNLNCSQLNLAFTTSAKLSLNTWQKLIVRLYPDKASVSINGSEEFTPITRETVSVSSIRLGGFHGQIDEFCYRSSHSSDNTDAPIQAQFNINDVNGFGSGSLGNVTLTANCTINSYARITFNNTSSGYIYSKSLGKFGDFAAGDEVMIYDPSTGGYDFGKLTYISSTAGANSTYAFTLEKGCAIPFNTAQIIKVPCFNSLVINSGVTVTPLKWNGYLGGIIAFKVKGDCTVNGKIITSGYGRLRTDNQKLTHSFLSSLFVMNTGGNIFIACGGKFTAGSAARIGATWSGSGKGGTGVKNKVGNPGGAGYGGSGGGDIDGGTGGNGGVGGGGGAGEDGQVGGNAGVGGGTGGESVGKGVNYGNATVYRARGGIQGAGTNTAGDDHTDGVAGAGAGGTAQAYSDAGIAYSGANLILLANTLSVDEAAISTGGGCPTATGYASGGGGGTGFCYIACKEMK